MEKLLKEIDLLKDEINKHKPLSQHLVRQIKEYYRIGLTYSSNAIEGNTLTESETKIVLEEGITVSGKPLIHHLEAVGLSEAYDFLYEEDHAKTFSEETIKQFHWLFYQRINVYQAGKYRQEKVFLTGSKHALPDPEEVPALMREWLVETFELRKSVHSVEFAALVHRDLVCIHPFIDGNGRVSRLLMNLILLQEGYTLAIIPPITRPTYIQSLEKSWTDTTDFVRFIAEMVRSLKRTTCGCLIRRS